ncbi:heterokaryon incompatibility protein-domain-containing protein [Aspergillus novoparasiticus]|uniref:Heterokaryon incompatibility protein-domain-containing protein n=1 Tax=Aspergillus novoparasiticus TaxID=986946 RepID=A0A5N6EFH9_9EURO|nr:heterokaryon incompatibility protein-domain-containing protein [Aspergillus novoparasiticus]
MKYAARLDEEFLIEEWRYWGERGGRRWLRLVDQRVGEGLERGDRQELREALQGVAGERWREVAQEISNQGYWEHLQQRDGLRERLGERLVRWAEESWASQTDDEVMNSFKPLPQPHLIDHFREPPLFGRPKSSVPPIDRSELLRIWLRSCDRDHPDCRADGSNHHPARVISVGEDDANGLQLLELECGVEYVALSYCWGRMADEQKPYLTTDENFQSRKEIGFNYNDLPKLFQDAITVTRELGKKYLWIDALCIIQGNKEDWKNEGTKMEHIFASAYCTLAPSSAFGWKEGFLNTYRARKPGVSLCGPNPVKYFRRLVDDGPLNKRAWVLQERVLSRRTVFFTSSGIYWECGEGVRCDNFVKLKW